MASYPTSIKSYTTKNTGETIQAAHINDLQLEVTAVETGLINGFEHVLKPLITNTSDIGTSSLAWRDIYVGTSIRSTGTVAAAGFLRLANATDLAWRNAGNSADVAFRVSAGNIFTFGAGVAPDTDNVY